MRGEFSIREFEAPSSVLEADLHRLALCRELPLVREELALKNSVFRGFPGFFMATAFNGSSGYRTATGVRPGLLTPFSAEAPRTSMLFCMLLSTRQDMTDNAAETHKALISWDDPNQNDLGNYVLPGSAKRFDQAESAEASNPPGSLTFEWFFGPNQIVGSFSSLEIWGRIDATRDSVKRESFRLARRRMESGGVVAPRVKAAGRVLTISWTLTLRGLT